MVQAYIHVFLWQWMPVNLNKIWHALIGLDSTTASRLPLPCKRAEHEIHLSRKAITESPFVFGQFGQFSNVLVMVLFLKWALACLCEHDGSHTSQKPTKLSLLRGFRFSEKEGCALTCPALTCFVLRGASCADSCSFLFVFIRGSALPSSRTGRVYSPPM